mgnify:CR=1 FL=1
MLIAHFSPLNPRVFSTPRSGHHRFFISSIHHWRHGYPKRTRFDTNSRPRKNQWIFLCQHLYFYRGGLLGSLALLGRSSNKLSLFFFAGFFFSFFTSHVLTSCHGKAFALAFRLFLCSITRAAASVFGYGMLGLVDGKRHDNTPFAQSQ